MPPGSLLEGNKAERNHSLLCSSIFTFTYGLFSMKILLYSHISLPPGNWLEGTKAERDHEEFNACVVGEELAVEVTFRNPLQVRHGT